MLDLEVVEAVEGVEGGEGDEGDAAWSMSTGPSRLLVVLLGGSAFAESNEGEQPRERANSGGQRPLNSPIEVVKAISNLSIGESCLRLLLEKWRLPLVSII